MPDAQPAVHPRGRGERINRVDLTLCPAGSSPRTRGTPPRASSTLVGVRFIPADAGNAHHILSHPAVLTVHPRGRGERGYRGAIVGHECGSSPRTRGTLAAAWRLLIGRRFIPADAGNATGRQLEHLRHLVHPRGRGERNRAGAGVTGKDGSSPRTRGTPVRPKYPLSVERFIPADAGNAFGSRFWSISKAVHPRGRGERNPISCAKRLPIGSSPRTRGTPWRPLQGTAHVRFIPADAGNAQ